MRHFRISSALSRLLALLTDENEDSVVVVVAFVVEEEEEEDGGGGDGEGVFLFFLIEPFPFFILFQLLPVLPPLDSPAWGFPFIFGSCK